jgi:predicted methyltransferase
VNQAARALLVLTFAWSAAAWTQPDADTRAALERAAAGSHRSDANRARDVYRHPVETLLFFGIRPDMTVVELSPGGGGWYTEILAPFLRENGKLYAASYDPESTSEYYRKNAKAYTDKLAAAPDVYDRVEVTVLAPPDKLDVAPPGSADLVVTFRNVHNWMSSGQAENVFRAAFDALKPGGTFGVTEHRADADAPADPKAESGYVREDYVIGLARKAGFELAEKSEINANPADTKDHPEGVWSLPPALRGGDVDRDKYMKIGESDRMTLKFTKPAK